MKNSFRINFIGIGAKKSATSWLAKCLSEHPEICIPSQKEIHFFSQDKKYEKGAKFYSKFFESCKKSKIKGEFSTSYFSNKVTPSRIKELFPNIKLILILRDPTERAISHLKHVISKRKIEKNERVEDMIKKFPGSVEVGMYAKYLKNWLDFFKKEQVLILFYEEIENNPKEVLRKTFKFLEVDSRFVSNSLKKKQNISSYRLSPLFIYINKFYLKLRKYKLGRFLIRTGRFIKISKMINFFLSKTKKDIKFSKEDKEYLRNFFIEDIENLENVLGMDLNNWK